MTDNSPNSSMDVERKNATTRSLALRFAGRWL